MKQLNRDRLERFVYGKSLNDMDKEYVQVLFKTMTRDLRIIGVLFCITGVVLYGALIGKLVLLMGVITIVVSLLGNPIVGDIIYRLWKRNES